MVAAGTSTQTSYDARHDLGRRGVVPLLLLSAVVVMTVAGWARGLESTNLHNGLLALAFTGVGAYIGFQRPGHREGLLFLATGTLEAVIFVGRQVGLTSSSPADAWWGWLGVWPVALGLGLTTLSVLCFPDGRLPSRRWRPVALGIVVVAVVESVLSALWPVEYDATGVRTQHPFGLPGADAADAVWSVVGHQSYAVLQALWVVAVVARWRASGRIVRVQLAWVGLAAGVSALALVVGLVGWGTPRAGLLAAALVPIAAGWAVVHGQHLATYAALGWLSRTPPGGTPDLATDLARASAEALAADGASLWVGQESELRAVGVWPENPTSGPVGLEELSRRPGLLRPVRRGDDVIGALHLDRAPNDRLSLVENRLLDDLVAQAVLVIEHLALVRSAARGRATGDLAALSPREREVLALMARGLTNAAICAELHLSIKTVEPLISGIFAKLGLHPDASSNRRVLAVVAFLQPSDSN